MTHKGHIFFSDRNSGLWATRLKPESEGDGAGEQPDDSPSQLWRNIVRKSLAFASFALLLLGGAAALAQSGMPATELPIRFAARAQARGTVATGSAARVELTVTAWSDDSDRDALLTVLAEQGPEALKAALQARPEVGRIRVAARNSYPIQYAREFATEDGGRMIRLITDRRISGFEAFMNTRISDFAFTIIELIVDGSYEGEGAAALGVEIVVDPETGRFRMQNYDNAPIRLSSVRRIEMQ